MPSEPDVELPKPKDLSHLLSESTRNRNAASVKAFYKYFSIPGIGQLAGGLPNPGYFLFDTLEAHAALPDRWKPTPSDPVKPPANNFAPQVVEKSISPSPFPSSSSHVLVPKDSGVADRSRKIDLTTSLQYGTAEGYAPLRLFLREFTRRYMHPSETYAGGPEIVLTCGSTDGFSKFLQAFNNEWVEGRDALHEREGLLVEEFTYMNAVQAASPRGISIVPVAMDDEGMLASGPGGLDEVLRNWDLSKGKRPHMMYTVTIGQNPTSVIVSLQRRREIYAVCQEFDVVVCEDDPYWYLQYPSANPSASPAHKEPSSGFDFLDSLVPSYVSIDVDGRVLRLDTFSKTVAPGCRMGWITGQPALVERLLRLTECTTQQPSGFVQSLVAELVMGPQSTSDPGRGGGPTHTGYQFAGWVRWLEGLRGNYEHRMNIMCKALLSGSRLVKTGRRPSLGPADDWKVVEHGPDIYNFRWPRGGMFLWLEVFFKRHPLACVFSGPQLAEAIWVLWTRKPYRVLVCPGTIFAPTEAIRKEKSWRFFRLCFAACDESEVQVLSERFVAGLHEFFRIRNPADIEALLKDMEEEKVGRMRENEGMEYLVGAWGC